MDRQVVYPGSIPLDTDLLQMQRNVMVAVGVLAQCVLGAGVVADGLPCVPAAAGYGVVVGPGSLSALSSVDVQPFGSLPADASALVKVAYNSSNTVLPFHGPADGNHALCWLIQAGIAEFDAGPVALPYYNAANPAVPWSGPLNNGAAQNTQRVVRVALSAKPGNPQGIGDRFPPLADAGWVGLYSVMTYFDRATQAVDIAILPGGPFVPFKLPALFPGFSRQEVFPQNTVWRAPPDVRSAKVRVVGAGGGGGGGDTDYAGGGGGAGGYAEGIVPVAPGSTVVVTVGIGGAGGAPRFNGTAGGGVVVRRAGRGLGRVRRAVGQSGQRGRRRRRRDGGRGAAARRGGRRRADRGVAAGRERRGQRVRRRGTQRVPGRRPGAGAGGGIGCGGRLWAQHGRRHGRERAGHR